MFKHLWSICEIKCNMIQNPNKTQNYSAINTQGFEDYLGTGTGEVAQ